jgi:hypothetical protein
MTKKEKEFKQSSEERENIRLSQDDDERDDQRS